MPTSFSRSSVRSRSALPPSPRCLRSTSPIWKPTVNTGLSEVIGSWKIMEISEPRSLQVFISRFEKIRAPVQDAALGQDAGVLLRQQTHHRERGHRLAAARFPHQRHRAALGSLEADALPRGAARGLVGAELDGEVAPLEQVHFSLGSSAPRMASVNRLKAVPSTAMKTVAAV